MTPGRPVKSKTLIPLIDALDEVVRELDAGRPQVCIAWTLVHPEVTTVLGGGESPAHVEENHNNSHSLRHYASRNDRYRLWRSADHATGTV